MKHRQRLEKGACKRERVGSPATGHEDERLLGGVIEERVLRVRRYIVAIDDPARMRKQTVGRGRVMNVAASVDEHGLVVGQVVVSAELPPGPADDRGRIEDVAQPKEESRRRGTIEGPVERGLELADGANRHVVDEHYVRPELSKGLQDELGA